MDYIVNMENTVAEVNAIGEGDTRSYGNYYLEIFNNSLSQHPSFRTYHLDSNTNNASINPQQVSWFSYKSAELNNQSATPALAFFHIPLQEYQTVAKTGNISGHWN